MPGDVGCLDDDVYAKKLQKVHARALKIFNALIRWHRSVICGTKKERSGDVLLARCQDKYPGN